MVNRYWRPAGAFFFLGSVLVAAEVMIIVMFWEDIVLFGYAQDIAASATLVVSALTGICYFHAAISIWARKSSTGTGSKLESLSPRAYLWLGLALSASTGSNIWGLFRLFSTFTGYTYYELGRAMATTLLVIVLGGTAIVAGLAATSLRHYIRRLRGVPEAYLQVSRAANIRERIHTRVKGTSHYFAQRNMMALALLGLILGTGIPALTDLFQLPRCNSSAMGFSSPAFELQTLQQGPHHNANLDNVVNVNQTVLNATVKGLWALTQIRLQGGFPMEVKPDGSQYASDRGFGCPLFPGEFSLQGGTALLAGLFLGMYDVEPDSTYLRIAEEAAQAIIAIQDEDGGIYYEGWRYPDGQGYKPHPLNERHAAILDDNVMQSSLSFLLDVYNVTKNQSYLTAAQKGLTLLLNVEKPHGGWPQRTRFAPDAYQSLVTLNDNSMRDVVFLMLKAYDMTGETDYLDTSKRACQFLIDVQGNGGSSFQQGWAQQYGDDAMPAWARSFEPLSICSSETREAMEILLEMFLLTNDTDWLAPIQPGVDYLNSSSTWFLVEGEKTWSRLYELETNHPIYGIEGGYWLTPQYVYNVAEARPGYSWHGDYCISEFFSRWIYLKGCNYNITEFQAWDNALPSVSSALSSAWDKYLQQETSGFWVNEAGNIDDSAGAGALSKMIQYLQLASS